MRMENEHLIYVCLLKVTSVTSMSSLVCILCNKGLLTLHLSTAVFVIVFKRAYDMADGCCIYP